MPKPNYSDQAAPLGNVQLSCLVHLDESVQGPVVHVRDFGVLPDGVIELLAGVATLEVVLVGPLIGNDVDLPLSFPGVPGTLPGNVRPMIL